MKEGDGRRTHLRSSEAMLSTELPSDASLSPLSASLPDSDFPSLPLPPPCASSPSSPSDPLSSLHTAAGHFSPLDFVSAIDLQQYRWKDSHKAVLLVSPKCAHSTT